MFKTSSAKSLSDLTLKQNASSTRATLGGDRDDLTIKRDFGTLRTRASASDEVDKKNPDLYVFRLSRRGQVKLTLENDRSGGVFDFLGTKRRVSAVLQDNNFRKLKDTNRVGPGRSDDFKVTLGPGTYYVEIKGRSKKDVDYTLKLRLEDE